MKEDEENEIAVLFDLENVVFRHIWSEPEKFSLIAGFRNFLSWLKGIGKISMFCVFFPSYFMYKGLIQSDDLEYFQQNGIFPIVCPKIGANKADTADATLIKWGLEVLLPHMSGITHLCVGSGDIDFIQLQEEAQKKGLQLIIAIGTPDSLSGEVEKGVSRDPRTGKPMVYHFSPYRE